VLAAGGYPEAPRAGGAITGEALDDPSKVLHAGTTKRDGAYVASGGRVLNAVGRGATLQEAVAEAYRVIEDVELEGSFYRTDIARRAIEGEISL